MDWVKLDPFSITPCGGRGTCHLGLLASFLLVFCLQSQGEFRFGNLTV
jgi:hypothetical protein